MQFLLWKEFETSSCIVRGNPLIIFYVQINFVGERTRRVIREDYLLCSLQRYKLTMDAQGIHAEEGRI